MPSFTLLRNARTMRITRTHKIAVAVLATAGATTALATTAAPSDTGTTTSAHAPAAVKPVTTNGLPAKTQTGKDTAAKSTEAAGKSTFSVADSLKVTAVAEQGHTAQQAADRSLERTALDVPKAAPKAAPKQYKNNLDGWIRQSLDIMKDKGIPGSYNGLHRNIMRESSGNPHAVNNWDINAINGIPSKGLLQVIQPTFDTYHVKGTPHKLTDPIANITAAANYAAHRYGSIDNVNSAY
ncbi:transglycosylase SLT domain-containing protein [Streptomyces pinistramenti]|uniref:transglycosylase SLT domain-containing protein n=1 Tax=Streptomyces pinistramenti TaxID=2884812 RepID=UPI001D08BAFC|nr:transglycosylase SLT domain-containing protein [Streptomyces pinistramenti]MCB5910698.1 transglycosylase SLT domain-containing protein [Streptomyces pinistramenti]